MSAYKSETVSYLVKNIDSDKLVLPAMQRNFVWPEDKIKGLFESLIRQYPVGTFLFWELSGDTIEQEGYTFNYFLKYYDEEQGKNQRGGSITKYKDEVYGVLDGQQRITAFYLGIKGYYRKKIKKDHPKYSKDNKFLNTFLCIDILKDPALSFDNMYAIDFVPDDEIGVLTQYNVPGVDDPQYRYWVKFADVFNAGPGKGFADKIIQKIEVEDFDDSMPRTLRDRGRDTLELVRNRIFVDQVISFYPAQGLSLAEVVDIFVRVNNGGQPLSAYDLMLSVAAGEDDGKDMHVKINDAIEYINGATKGDGIKVSTSLILNAGLMFTGNNTDPLKLNAKTSYSHERIQKIMEEWENIVNALFKTSEFFENIGINGSKLADTIILSVAYYFYKDPKKTDQLGTAKSLYARRNRVLIRQWVIRSIYCGVFSEGTGRKLLAVRNNIDKSKDGDFPLGALIHSDTIPELKFDEDVIRNILNLKYEDPKVEPILRDLMNDSSSNKYDKDHMWPISVMSKKNQLKTRIPNSTDEEREQFRKDANKLPNIQLLVHSDNQGKGTKELKEYLEEQKLIDDTDFFKQQCIPNGISLEFSNFREFYDRRSELLEKRILDAYPDTFDEILTKFGFVKKA